MGVPQEWDGGGVLIDPAALVDPAALADPAALPVDTGGGPGGRAAMGPTGRPFPRFYRPGATAAARSRAGGGGVQPEGRRRQDHHHDQPRGVSGPRRAGGSCWWILTRRAASPSGWASTPNGLAHTVYDLLTGSGVAAADVVLSTRVDRLDLLPSNIDLSAAEVQLVGEVAREFTLARALRPLTGSYDVVLIDCQPSLGLLTVNALTAAAGVLIPLECEFFALRGVALLTATIEKVRERLNPDLVVDGVLGTMFDSRTVHGREVLARVVEAFGDEVFHTVITRTVRFPETTVAGEPITSYAPSSPGAFMYRQVAREFTARVLGPRPR